MPPRRKLAQAQANDVKAQNDLMRYKQLVDKQEISEQQYDQAVAAAKSSSDAVNAARSSAAAADQQIHQQRAKVLQAQANFRASQTGPQQVAQTRARAQSALATVQQKQAALEQAKLNLQYTKIMSPIEGTVMKDAEVGMNVQIGQQLFTVVPLSDIWVTANFKETQLKYMRPGQRAEIKVDANGRTYKAPRGQHLRLKRRPPKPAPARKRHGKLRKGSAAHPGKDRLRAGREQRPLSPPRNVRRSKSFRQVTP